MLLVLAAYINLYLTFRKMRRKSTRTKLPISSKQWEESKSQDKLYNDNNLKMWLENNRVLDR